MSGPSSCSIYIGNLDERVSDRVLYDILIQAGRVVDLHIPRDRETEKPKGYAFAEYETEEIADYAVKLFSGLVTLYNRTLKFAISGQDKLAQNNSNGAVPGPNSSNRQRPSSHPAPLNNFEISNHSVRSSAPSRVSTYPANDSLAPPGVTNLSNGYGSNSNGNSNDSDRRLLGPQSMPLAVLGLDGMIQVTQCHIPIDFSIEDLVGCRVLYVILESPFG
ncbi:hypothetical protein OIU85_003315 [Salix viminalis]|uniref:RRM domain-containing protein n=1 Tax=Salix viminalis TaxID=40686 RepID=A0A9Q0PYW1_SALVM|nr:hypothetical protein OIU85_003315 [Salix viminalis]